LAIGGFVYTLLAVAFETVQALCGLVFDGTHGGVGALTRFDVADPAVALDVRTEVNFAVVSYTWNTLTCGGVTNIRAITCDIFTEIGLAFWRVVVGTGCRKQK
jgi:hypothetical protein